MSKSLFVNVSLVHQLIPVQFDTVVDYRLAPVDKTKAKPPIDKLNPIIRTETVTPERFSDAPRATTSRAALMQPRPQVTKIRKGQLSNVQLLPSKFGRSQDDTK